MKLIELIEKFIGDDGAWEALVSRHVNGNYHIAISRGRASRRHVFEVSSTGIIISSPHGLGRKFNGYRIIDINQKYKEIH